MSQGTENDQLKRSLGLATVALGLNGVIGQGFLTWRSGG